MTKQYDNFADLITFTRASTGTYLDSDGLLKTATTNVPRIEYDINGNRKGLLIEEARTNLLTYSDFDAAVPTNWSAPVDAGTFSRTLGTEIQGTPTITNVQSTDGRSFLSQSLTLSASTTYTFSCKFDPAASNISAGNTVVALIDGLGGITVPLGRINDIDPVTGLLTFTFTTAADGTGNLRIGIGVSASATGTLVFSQPQLEAGSFPTSYIPTAGAAASRSADVASIPTSAFGYNADKGTVVCEFERNQNAAVAGFAHIVGSSGDGIDFFGGFGNPRQQRFDVRVAGVTVSQIILTNAIETGTVYIMAGAYSENDFAGAIDGVIAGSDTAGAIPLVSNFLIGVSASTTFLNGHIKSIQYYPRRLTNAQIVRLTS